MKPIINPSTLTEEQREAIRAKYLEIKKINDMTYGMFLDDTALFEWLFGKDFFENE